MINIYMYIGAQLFEPYLLYLEKMIYMRKAQIWPVKPDGW